jgi:hypothetical protein
MNLDNLQRISAASESACIAVLQKPEDAAARKRLFGALGDVVDPSFQGEEAAEYYSSQLIPEVRLWAEIVRTRIRLARDRTTLKATLRITYSIQQLLLMLSDLAGEYSRINQAIRLVDSEAGQSAHGAERLSAAFPGQAGPEASAHGGR